MAGDSTRDRLLTATAELFRRHGYTGTGMKDVIAAAGATFGSLYHWFPEGKEQLGEEVVRRSGQAYFELFVMIYDDAPDPVTAVRNFFSGAAEVLAETDYVDACPIGTIALEVASTNERLRIATQAVFDLWVDGATERLRAAGIPKRRAREVALTLVALLEGAFMLSRAARSVEPMHVAGRTAASAVEQALADANTAAATKRAAPRAR
jgi:AcrR family transcriptional regulator